MTGTMGTSSEVEAPLVESYMSLLLDMCRCIWSFDWDFIGGSLYTTVWRSRGFNLGHIDSNLHLLCLYIRSLYCFS